jgi:AcrR family transcriptional regulator
VLRAALDFVDANGLAALSMHKLGAEVGVQGMSLYSHVENKDELLDGIVEAMAAEAEPPPADGTGWRDALRLPGPHVFDLVVTAVLLPLGTWIAVTRPDNSKREVMSAADGGHRAGGLQEAGIVDAVSGQLGRDGLAPDGG